MAFYRERVAPRIINVVCGSKSLRPLRARVCAELTGDVVEIGFGSGSNIGFYAGAVTSVTAIEPSDVAWKLAGKRVASSAIPIERAGLDGQSLPFPDASFDSALTTWTLCTIPDPIAALREVRRVLRPGGALHFLEHGLAPDLKVQKWQYRLDPLERRVAAGCTFTRPVVEMLTTSGFAIKEIDVFYEKSAPKFAAAESLGIAVPA